MYSRKVYHELPGSRGCKSSYINVSEEIASLPDTVWASIFVFRTERTSELLLLENANIR